jgi:nanoRNase/pAp phosphatase (c-di-AMP/oligoRNAs hydrolase)
MSQQSVYIIFHKTHPNSFCIDGAASAWLLYNHYQNYLNSQAEIIFIPCWYSDLSNSLNSLVKSNSLVYVVDYSLSSREIQILSGLNCEMVFIDHHLSMWDRMFEITNWVKEVAYKVDECGSTLTFNYLYKDINPYPFLKYIKAADIRTKEWFKEETKEIYLGIFDRPLNTLTDYFQLFDSIKYSYDQDLKAIFKEKGKIVRKETLKEISQLEPNAKVYDSVHNNKVLLCEYPIEKIYLRSNLAEELLMNPKYAEVDYAAVYYYEDNSYNLSLRSLNSFVGKDFNVKQIAAKYGGGGHKNASGCSIKNLSELITL